MFDYIKANGTGYMVMDYVEGPTFEAWLREDAGPPAAAELHPIVEKVFDALDYAHSCNSVHRDVAPDNIVLRKGNDRC